MTTTRARKLVGGCVAAVTLGLLVGLVGPTPTTHGRHLEVAALAAAPAAAALPAALPAPSDVLFSVTLHATLPSIGRWAPDAAFAAVARAVCRDFAVGFRAPAILAREHQVNPRLPDLVFASAVYAGVVAYCPQLDSIIVTRRGR